MFERVFHVTLWDTSRAPTVFLLSDLAQELRNENNETDGRLEARKHLLDRVLMARLLAKQTPVFEYLLQCHQRASTELRRAINASPQQVLEYAAEQCVAHMHLALTNRDMFQQPADVAQKGSGVMLPFLLSNSVPESVLLGIVKRVTENGQMQAFGPNLLGAVVVEMNSKTVLSPDVTQPIDVFLMLMKVPELRRSGCAAP